MSFTWLHPHRQSELQCEWRKVQWGRPSPAITPTISSCWDELDFTHGQNIGSSVELSWHLRATSSELVANDAWSCNQGCWCHVTMMLISPGRWPGDGVALCLYSGMGTHGECGSPLPRPSWTTQVLGAKQTLRPWRMSVLSGPDVP